MDEQKKITHADALARAMKGETVEFIQCPHCNGEIAVYMVTVVSENPVKIEKSTKPSAQLRASHPMLSGNQD